MITKKKEETEIKLEGFDAILQAQQKEFIAQKNHLLAGIEGEAKTGKSGLAMDTGFKTFYLDCDVGAVPTWKTNHDSTNRILIYNPNAKDENGDSDPYKTQGNIRTFIAHVALEIKKSQEPILFVWDGVDSWLDDCTTYMTGMENSRMRPFNLKNNKNGIKETTRSSPLLARLLTSNAIGFSLLIRKNRLEMNLQRLFGTELIPNYTQLFGRING